MNKMIKDMTGQRFGRLLVVKFSEVRHENAHWLCKCDCGKTTIVSGGALRNGATRSCNCLRIELMKKNLSLPENEGALRALYRARKHDAKRRGYAFDLSVPEFDKIIHGACVYCGTSPKQIFRISSKPGVAYVYNGIDRVDNLKGYSVANSVPCCGVCNTMKGRLSSDVFLSQVTKIFKTRGV